MTDAAAASMTQEIPTRSWKASDPHVRNAVVLIKEGRITTPEQLIEWDRDHGRRLVDWDDPRAAEWARRAQAVQFFNYFRATFDKMRVRAFIHVHEDAEAGIESSGYAAVERIAEHPGMRAQVISDITRRMRTLASELRMWKLTDQEQAELFARLQDAIHGSKQRDEAA